MRIEENTFGKQQQYSQCLWSLLEDPNAEADAECRCRFIEGCGTKA